MSNPNCDGGRCHHDTGEVRVMPLGGGANLILCRWCFAYENQYRRDRARDSGAPERWPTVSWETAKPYPER